MKARANVVCAKMATDIQVFETPIKDSSVAKGSPLQCPGAIATATCGCGCGCRVRLRLPVAVAVTIAVAVAVDGVAVFRGASVHQKSPDPGLPSSLLPEPIRSPFEAAEYPGVVREQDALG